VGFLLPKLTMPTQTDIDQAAWLLSLPQIPLSLVNSVVATAQTSRDLFPERAVSVRKIGITYGVMILIAPFSAGSQCAAGAVAWSDFMALAPALGARRSFTSRFAC
jgi:hypothetical protein